ncbi:hypothetical protein SRHO_G00329500 [Serrasalmus rhombeus]
MGKGRICPGFHKQLFRCPLASLTVRTIRGLVRAETWPNWNLRKHQSPYRPPGVSNEEYLLTALKKLRSAGLDLPVSTSRKHLNLLLQTCGGLNAPISQRSPFITNTELHLDSRAASALERKQQRAGGPGRDGQTDTHNRQ